ncbi:hypothetical protein [Agrococcus baldri]|uniref:Uncharacterized protein n=1 Tax=Agrococcus baldri TaxID=153730 RepID=A0AA87RIF6_9MICO|nr:hypothetical protein [Agrococcus baldri]GEK79943.1 hypothetical protein ABA31_12940 [Agrococcus baldri]
MAGPLRVEHDVGLARWLPDALADDGTIAVVVPPIFEAYARILHPATLDMPTGETDAWGAPQYASREITWDEAASLIGDRLGERQPWTLWLSRFGEVGYDSPEHGRMVDGHVVPEDTVLPSGVRVPAGSRIQDPEGSDVPLPLLAALAELLVDEHGDAEVLTAAWEGSGLDPSGTSAFFLFDEGMSEREQRREAKRLQAELHAARLASIDPEVTAAMRASEVLGLPREGQGRGHVLLRARLATFRDPRWVESAGLGWIRGGQPEHPDERGRTPNAMWPVEPAAAPAWFVATELDLDCTLVGGSARLIDRLLADPALETERIRPTDTLVDSAAQR